MEEFRKKPWFYREKIALSPNLGDYTCYCSAKDCLTECLLPLEIVYPDSMSDLYIETFPLIGKPM